MKNPENDPQDPLWEGTNPPDILPHGDIYPPRGLRQSVLSALLLLDEPTDETANQPDLRGVAKRCLLAFLLGFILGQGEVSMLWSGL